MTKTKNNNKPKESLDKTDLILELLQKLLVEIEKLKKDKVSAEEIFVTDFPNFGGKK
jgi:hypothetical protein